ncbi:MAG: hypothetical protein ACXWQO_04230 [Bdellovibrionota bacterium]
MPRAPWLCAALTLLLFGCFAPERQRHQGGKLSVRGDERAFNRFSGKYSLKVETSNQTQSGEKPENRVEHIGWHQAQSAATSASASLNVVELKLDFCGQENTPALNRVGIGTLLVNPSAAGGDRFAFAFTGFLKGFHIPGVSDNQLHRFYVVMLCKSECLVLPDYLRNKTDTKILAFHSEPAESPHANFEIQWDKMGLKFKFIRDFKSWGEVTLPKSWPAIDRMAHVKFDAGHFIPGCGAETKSMVSEVQFSDLKGF